MIHVPDHERLTKHFFRSVNSPALLRRFFERFEIWDALKVKEMPSDSDIFDAWEEYEGERRNAILEQLCRINDIARERGRFTLQNKAESLAVPNYQDLSLQKLAMILFIDYPAAFQQAYEFFIIEKAENLITLLGRTPTPCSPTDAQIAAFKEGLAAALRAESHGTKARIEVAGEKAATVTGESTGAPAQDPKYVVDVEQRHPDKWMAAIPHETYVKPDQVFGSGEEIVTKDRRPVFEMVLIYYPSRGVLKLNVGRGWRKATRVAAVFAEHVLGKSSDFFELADIVKFAALQRPDFSFDPLLGDRHQSAIPTCIRFKRLSRPGVEHEIRCRDGAISSRGVLDVLAEEKIAMSEIEVEALTVCFRFSKKTKDKKSVELSLPARVPLDETERDRYVESILVRLGLVDHLLKERIARAEQAK